MLHWDIAFDIYQQGVNRILFLPMKARSYCDNLKYEFIEQYNYMLEGNYTLLRVPYVTDEMFIGERKKYRLARKLNNDEYIIWMPVNMIRTALCEQEQYRDKPITDFTPYIRLFTYLSGKEDSDISEYIRLYGKVPDGIKPEAAFQYVIEKRHILYDFFEENFHSGNMEYFAVAAPKAEWNEKGYVNLCEGQHRCVYLLTKGLEHFPVRVDQTVINHIS